MLFIHFVGAAVVGNMVRFEDPHGVCFFQVGHDSLYQKRDDGVSLQGLQLGFKNPERATLNADHGLGLTGRKISEESGGAEIAEKDLAILIDHYVVRVKIAMADAAIVKMFQQSRHLSDDPGSGMLGDTHGRLINVAGTRIETRRGRQISETLGNQGEYKTVRALGMAFEPADQADQIPVGPCGERSIEFVDRPPVTRNGVFEYLDGNLFGPGRQTPNGPVDNPGRPFAQFVPEGKIGPGNDRYIQSTIDAKRISRIGQPGKARQRKKPIRHGFERIVGNADKFKIDAAGEVRQKSEPIASEHQFLKPSPRTERRRQGFEPIVGQYEPAKPMGQCVSGNGINAVRLEADHVEAGTTAKHFRNFFEFIEREKGDSEVGKLREGIGKVSKPISGKIEDLKSFGERQYFFGKAFKIFFNAKMTDASVFTGAQIGKTMHERPRN
jgi:hypothetical protein